MSVAFRKGCQAGGGGGLTIWRRALPRCGVGGSPASARPPGARHDTTPPRRRCHKGRHRCRTRPLRSGIWAQTAGAGGRWSTIWSALHSAQERGTAKGSSGGAVFGLVHQVGQFVGLGTAVGRLRSRSTHPGDVVDVTHERARPRARLRVPTPPMWRGFRPSVRHRIRTVRPAPPRAPVPTVMPFGNPGCPSR